MRQLLLLLAAVALPHPVDASRAPPPPASSAQERTQAYLQLLNATNWLDFVEGRVQGHPTGPHAYGLWWGGGDTITKSQRSLMFTHQGTDDNGGIITSPVLEGVCHGAVLWPALRPRLFPILESLVRGFTAWMLAQQRSADDPAYPATPLLSRNLFPPDGARHTTAAGVEVVINTSKVRHGSSGEFSGTIHVPHNPYFGDLWVQAKRSQDDVGHMLRAMALLLQPDGCLSPQAEPPQSLLAAVAQMRTLYASWAAEVERDGWKIASLNESLKRYLPSGGGGAFDFTMTANAECCGPLALRLLSAGDEGPLRCGDGIEPPERAANALKPDLLDNDNKEIARSQHEAGDHDPLHTSFFLGCALTPMAPRQPRRGPCCGSATTPPRRSSAASRTASRSTSSTSQRDRTRARGTCGT